MLKVLCSSVIVVALAGCGGVPPDPGGPVPTSTTRPSPPVSTGPEVTATGTVIPGVEPGCLILHTGTEDYLLLDGDRTVLRPGVKAIVHGVPKHDRPSTCQQGTPLVVIDARLDSW